MSEAEETTEGFQAKLNDVAAKGLLGLGVAIGVSSGLLARMAAFSEPHTCQEIAEKCKLKERYVREWLAIMVCGGVVDLDSTSQSYFIPHHRRPCFTAGCPEEEASLVIRCLPMLASSFDKVIECMQSDGSLGFSSDFTYNPEMSRVWFEHHLLEELGKTPGLRDQLEAGIRVVDIACGAGISTRVMAARFPKSDFTGLDIDDDVIATARKEAANQGVKNVEFVRVSGMGMPADWSGRFDFLLIYNGVHDAFRPDQFLAESFRILKPGGKAQIHEPYVHSNLADNIPHPGGGTFTFSLFRCLPTAMRAPDHLGLGAGWGQDACKKMLQDTGFDVVSVEPAIGAKAMKTWRFSCTKPLE